MGERYAEPMVASMTAVVLVLAHADDAGAASVAAAVRSLLVPRYRELEVWGVRPETLGLASWLHTVDTHGRPHTLVALPGRPELDSAQILAVFNRIQYLPTLPGNHASAQDQAYAERERQSLVLSWLLACGDRAVQPLRSQAGLMSQLPARQWAAAASRCGLQVAAGDATTPVRPWDATVLVAGAHTTGVLATRLGKACLAIAQALGFTLLEFRFVRRADAVELVDVCPHPKLSDLEDIDAVARCIADLSSTAARSSDVSPALPHYPVSNDRPAA